MFSRHQRVRNSFGADLNRIANQLSSNPAEQAKLVNFLIEVLLGNYFQLQQGGEEGENHAQAGEKKVKKSYKDCEETHEFFVLI